VPINQHLGGRPERLRTEPQDVPELADDWFVRADVYEGSRLIRKGGGRRSA